MEEILEQETQAINVDELWTDEGQPVDQPEAQEEAQEEDKPDQEEADPAHQEQKEEAPADQPESFALKHLDETKTVGRKEVVALAQKGMDYDRIREERDQLRTYRQEADPALTLVKTYAERNGMSVADYLDFCRKQELMGQGVNEQTATAQVEVEKQTAALQSQQAGRREEEERQQSILQQAQQRQEARQRDMEEFLTTYPGVKPEDIPKQVWEQVAQGGSLVTAYTFHQNRRLEADLAAERQNRQNTQLAPGSLGSQGEKGSRTIGDLWDETDI